MVPQLGEWSALPEGVKSVTTSHDKWLTTGTTGPRRSKASGLFKHLQENL